MPGTIKIIVRDAVEQVVPGATVDLDGTQKTTGADGIVDFPTPPTKKPNTLIVTHPQFVTEKVNFYDGLTLGKFDNPLLERKEHLIIRLGRLYPVPKQRMDTPDKFQLYQDNIGRNHPALDPKEPVGAATRYKDGYETYWSYLEKSGNREVALAAGKLLRDPKNPKTPWGPRPWDRMNRELRKVKIRDFGRLFFLFHGPGIDHNTGPFLVAVWSPNIYGPEASEATVPLKSLDYILYYMPDTDNWLTTYPFGFFRNEYQTPLGQFKLEYSMWDLIERYGFASQLAARGRWAPIIMPINKGTTAMRPGGSWGPYGTREGAWRLCSEVNLFLHRELRTSPAGQRLMEPFLPDRWAGGSLRDLGNLGFAYQATSFGAPPTIRHLATCCFSSGGKILADLLAGTPDFHTRTGPYIKPENAFYWGAPKLKDFNKIFDKAWREVWDLDGKSADWDSFLRLAMKWYEANDSRILRFWRTGAYDTKQLPDKDRSKTRHPDPKISNHKLWKILLPTKTYEKYIHRVIGQGSPAWELQGDRWSGTKLLPGGEQATSWSLVYLGPSYFLEGNPNPPPQPPPPPFPMAGIDEHQAASGLGFSHAIQLSDIGIPEK